ncbi:MAG TPA: DUF1189 domain-containing protein [Candidatus Vogelbacteria bacterium]|nr:DUF1189 domain-containing protein [Candidatus Vogelbacteria bacterium]
MNLFNFLNKNIYNPSFYLSIKDKNLNFSLGYYLILSLFTSLVITIFFFLFFLLPVSEFFWNIRPGIINIWPTELAIEIEDGQVKSVRPFWPYKFTLPEDLKKTSPVEYLMTIDLDTLNTDPLQHDSLILMTKDSIYISSDISGQPTKQSFKNVFSGQKVTINKDYINNLLMSADRGYKILLPLFTLLSFIFFFLILLGWLLIVFFVALFAQIIIRKYYPSISYLKSFQYCLHGATGGMLFAWLPVLFSFDLAFSVPQYLLFSAGILLVINTNFEKLRKRGKLDELNKKII